MSKSNKKKSEQLGMPFGTANGRLRKKLLFKLLVKCGENVCYQCGQEILNISDMSIEHKVPWLDSTNPTELFFDLENIAFSHLDCNIRAGRRNINTEHGTLQVYRKGCRCSPCKEAKSKYRKDYISRTGNKRG